MPITRFLLFVSAISLAACSLIRSEPESEASTSEPSLEEVSPTEEIALDPTPDPATQVAKEITNKKDKESSGAESDLIRTARKLYQSGMLTVAREAFQSLKDGYPSGAYAPLASMKLADSYYHNNEFLEAGRRYDEFTKTFPGSPDLAYVKLQAARSLILGSKGKGRDKAPFDQALTLLESIISDYPNTQFALSADQERLKVVEELASYDQMIIDFYEKRENSAAVLARKEQFNNKWAEKLRPIVTPKPLDSDSTADIPAAVAVFANDEQSPNPAVGTPEVEVPREGEEEPISAPVLVMAQTLPSPVPTPLTVESSPEPVIVSQIEPEQLTTPTPLPVREITKITCRTKGSLFALIELSADLSDEQKGKIEGQFFPSAGLVTVNGVTISSRQPRFDCFTTKDFNITTTGHLTARSRYPISVSVLSRPARLLLIPQIVE